MAANKIKLTLLGPAWTRTSRCIWMLEELGLPYQHVEEKTRPQSRLVRKYNPTGKVPVLLDYTGGDHQHPFVLTDSAAINTYLGDRYRQDAACCSGNAAALLVPPAGTKDRALYDQAVMTIMSELDAQGMWMYRKHVELTDFFEAIPQMRIVARTQFLQFAHVLAKQCCPYLLGQNFTAADILYVNLLDWACGHGWIDSSPATANAPSDDIDRNLIAVYLQKCRNRPAYIRMMQLHDESLARMKQQDQERANKKKAVRPHSKL